MLLSESQMEEIKNTGMILKNIPVFQINLPSVSNQSSQCFNEYLQEAEKKGEALFLIYFILLILLPCSLSPELGTDYCGSDSHVERFRGFLSLWIIGDIKFPIDECFHFFSFPLPSFPITISPLVDNGCSYMFSPSKNVPNTGVSPSE